ncbi:helix-turn-helix domain-containing protein [Mycobacterium sp. URHB0021]
MAEREEPAADLNTSAPPPRSTISVSKSRATNASTGTVRAGVTLRRLLYKPRLAAYVTLVQGALAVEKSSWTEEYLQVCALLRVLRRDAGLTQAAVAERLGVPQSFVSK